MKKTNKIAAMAAAALLAGAVAIPSVMMAVSATNVSISEDSAEGKKDQATHSYKAYPIFAGTQTDAGLMITGWGDGFKSNGLLTDADFQSLFPAAISTESTAAQVAQAIEALNITNNSEKADALAAILSKYVGGTPEELSNVPKNLDAGYWIVLDSYTDAVQQDAVSKYILRVTGGTEEIAITPKKSYPSVEKKVLENVKEVTDKPVNDPTTTEKWNDVADYCIGDAVPFKLYGTLPSTYADYEHYYYKFTDTLAASFDAPTADAVTVCVNGAPIQNAEGETNMRVSVAGQVITVSFEDIKKFAPLPTDIITVEYDAVLNGDAVIGLPGQENKVDLTYSNNPNIVYNPNTSDTDEDVPKDDNGTPEDTTDDTESTDTTPEDKVIVFTYQQNIKKVDSATGNPLSAVFTLSRENGTTTEYVRVNDSGKVIGWTTDKASASGLTTDGSTGLCTVIGLDDGTYTLTEETAPDGGYNEIEPVTLTITAATANDQNWSGVPGDALTAIALDVSGDSHGSVDGTFASTTDNGTVQAKITNDKGISLPTTGGIGTKLFIIGGGTAAALAGIYLISKKRSKEEDAE